MKRIALIFITIILIVSAMGLVACNKKDTNYTVSFDMGYDNIVHSVVVKEGSKVTFPTIPEREGYRFDRWEVAGKPFDKDTPIQSDMMIRASWVQLKAIDVSVLGKVQRVYLEPKSSYEMSELGITVEGMTLDGYYRVVDGRVEMIDFAKGLNDNEKIYANVMSQGLTMTEIEGKNAYAVTGCSADQTSIAIPVFYNDKRVTEIGVRAFHDVAGKELTAVDLGAVTIIREGALSELNVESLTIPSTVVTIEQYALANSAIKYLEFDTGSSLRDLASHACDTMYNLESVKLPDGLTKLNSYTFHNSERLKKAYVPRSVVNIENHVFLGCLKMEIIYRETSKAEDDGNIEIGPEWRKISGNTSASIMYDVARSSLDW